MTKKRTAYHHGDLRSAIVAKAIEILASNKGADFSMRELALSLGVSHAAAYRHFEDRGALLTAIAVEGFTRLGKYQQQGLKEGLAPLARLKHLGVSYVKFALAHPSHFRVMFGSTLAERKDSPQLGSIAEGTFTPVVEEVRRCQEAKLLAKGNPQLIALALWSSVHGLSMLLIDGQAKLSSGNQTVKEAEITEVLTTAIMRGFGATT